MSHARNNLLVVGLCSGLRASLDLVKQNNYGWWKFSINKLLENLELDYAKLNSSPQALSPSVIASILFHILKYTEQEYADNTIKIFCADVRKMVCKAALLLPIQDLTAAALVASQKATYLKLFAEQIINLKIQREEKLSAIYQEQSKHILPIVQQLEKLDAQLVIHENDFKERDGERIKVEKREVKPLITMLQNGALACSANQISALNKRKMIAAQLDVTESTLRNRRAGLFERAEARNDQFDLEMELDTQTSYARMEREQGNFKWRQISAIFDKIEIPCPELQLVKTARDETQSLIKAFAIDEKDNAKKISSAHSRLFSKPTAGDVAYPVPIAVAQLQPMQLFNFLNLLEIDSKFPVEVSALIVNYLFVSNVIHLNSLSEQIKELSEQATEACKPSYEKFLAL